MTVEVAGAPKGAPETSDVARLTEPAVGTPWESWPAASVTRLNLSQLVATAVGGPLVLHAGDVVAEPSKGALRELSTRVGFPIDFVSKLPNELQAAVLNDRIEAATDSRFTVAHRRKQVAVDGMLQDDPTARTVTNISPGWRGILAHADVAQTVYGLLMDVYGGVEVKHATQTDSEMRLRLLTPYVEHVTRKVGDIMRLGIDARHSPGMALQVSLFAEKLSCLNGMTACDEVFDWGSRAVGKPEDQLVWLTIGVANAIAAFDALVDRARTMAATPVEGDLERALIERARAMRVPQRFDERLLASFKTDPGADEWAMLNAFTHLATHGGIPVAASDALMASAGGWASGFDMVTARLPRPLALSTGAHILEANDGQN